VKWWLVLLTAALTSGCGSFGKPALPKMPAAETRQTNPANEEWAPQLRVADVIYFSLTKSWATDEQPVWQIVEMMQRRGQRIALGWAEVPSRQQALLDQWQRQEISAPQLLDQLVAPERADLLRHALRPDLAQVALGSSRELLARIRAGEALSEEERTSLPSGFRPRPDAFENFVDRVTTSSALRRYNVRHLYRAHLVAEQTIAENVARFIHDNPNAKLLVFLPDDLMINPREIADFAGQKTPLRQMILDRLHSLPDARGRLLAQR
jgi:Haem-binding uptake, Tiki superfamily, ChaN